MQFNFLEDEQIEPKWKDCVCMELAIPLHSYCMPVLGGGIPVIMLWPCCMYMWLSIGCEN